MLTVSNTVQDSMALLWTVPKLTKTGRLVSVDWVACGTQYTKTEGTELGGIEGSKTGFSQE